MKNVRFLMLAVLLLCSSMMQAWWPSEYYCKFIRTFKIDNVWEVNFTGNAWDAGGSGDYDSRVTTKAAPGYIAWSCMSWDNCKAGGDDYDVDYLRVELYNKATQQYMRLFQADFYPENNKDNSWAGNWRNEGLYNPDPNWSINYNDCKTYFVKKLLYQKWADGIQFCYFVTKYSDKVRKFIDDANQKGQQLQVYVYTRYDSSSYGDWWGFTDLRSEDNKRIKTPATPTGVTVDGYGEVNGKTQLKFTAPAPLSAPDTLLIQATDDKSYSQLFFNTTQGSHGFDLSSIKDLKTINDGDITVYADRFTYYSIPIARYDDTKKWELPKSYQYKSGVYKAQAPQLRLAKNLEASWHRSDTVMITWKADLPASGRSYDESDWLIERCTDGEFNANTMDPTQRVTYDSRKSEYSFPDLLTDRGQGTKTYYYRVVRDRELSRHVPAADNTTHVQVNTDYRVVSKMNVTQTGPKSARIDWVLNDGMWSQDMRLKLFVNNTEQMLDDAERGMDGSVEVENLDNCHLYKFELRVMDGQTLRSSAARDSIVFPSDELGIIKELHVSKGYHNDHVHLSWTVTDTAQNFARFALSRKEYGDDDNQYKLLSTIQFNRGVLDYSYDDKTVTPGTFYSYRLQGITVCDQATSVSFTQEDIGFSRTFGVVSGQINYESGQAVSGATVEATVDGEQEGMALQVVENGKIWMNPKKKDQTLTRTAGAMELWVKTDNWTDISLAEQDSAFEWKVQNSSVILNLTGKNQLYSLSAALDSKVDWSPTGFNHLAFSYQHVGDSITQMLYVNGHVAGSRKVQAVAELLNMGQNLDTFYIGGKNGHFIGYLDDIRIWKTARDSAQIAANYNRQLAGKEDGLAAYFRCDDPIQGNIFDGSYTGSTYHENDFRTLGCKPQNSIRPTAAQLAMRCLTDESGHYLLNAIPIAQDGSLYRIQPRLGTHQFDPTVRSLFFNAAATTHNNIDFTDNSSFTVSGTVVYAGGNYPASGIQFKVDGTAQVSQKGGAIQTDEEGHFSLQVPIGVHTVQAYATGHKLQNDGFLQMNGSDYIDFEQDYSNILLADSTRVRFIGRVCGGKVQSELPVGHTVSRNNLGDSIAVHLEQMHPTKYDLATTLWSDTLIHKTPSIYAIDSLNVNRKAVKVGNRVDYKPTEITIYANDSTGEFYADVLPIKYTVRVSLPNYPQFEADGSIMDFTGLVSSETQQPEIRNYKDSLARYMGDSLVWSTAENYFDTVYYMKKQVFTTRVCPTFDFYQVDANGKRLNYFGAKSTNVVVKNNTVKVPLVNDTMLVASRDSDFVRYAFQKPCYVNNLGYSMVAHLSEIYPHYAANSNQVLWTDTVPTTDGVVTVDNTMANPTKTTFSLNENGYGLYQFSLSDPNLTTGQGQLKAQVQYNNKKNSLPWDAPFNETGSCYYTGDHKLGGDFITAGPNDLITILRDPPGAGSYSYLDAGTSLKKSRDYSWKKFENGKLGINFSFGYDVKTWMGLGFAIGSELKATNSEKTGWQHDNSWTNSTTVDQTYTLSQRFQTSASETAVGPDADVFVGHATNYALAEADQVILVDTATYRAGGTKTYTKLYGTTQDSAYVLTTTRGISCSQGFGTTFIYTQKDILTTEIPKLEQLLPTILRPYDKNDSLACVQKANNEKKLYYMSKPGITSSSPNFGQKDTYYIIAPDSAHLPKDSLFLRQDTLMRIRGWIDDWKFYLGMNEYQKWKAHEEQKTLVDNYSISGRSSFTMTETYNTALTFKHNRTCSDNWFLEHSGDTKNQAGVYFGMNLVFSENVGTVSNSTESNTETRTHTKGFVIVPNNYERLSFDVYHEPNWTQDSEYAKTPKWDDTYGSDVSQVSANIQDIKTYPSYIFYTRGGQTCCPYEPEQHSRFLQFYLEKQIEADSLARDALSLPIHKADLQKIIGKVVKLSESTLQIDHPRLTADQSYISGVPSGQAAYVTLHLGNESESDQDRPYFLIQKESSNPHGAQLSIDGTSIGTALINGCGVSYLVPAGSTLDKTLTITRGSVLDYDNLTIYMVPACDAYSNKQAIMDSCSFSVHFTPTCSDIHVKSPNANWVYNTELETATNPGNNKSEHYLTVELDDFDVNYTDFDHIELQFKPSSESESRWQKLQYFYKDSAALKQAWASGILRENSSLCTNGTIRYQLFLDDRDDQNYDLRAVSYCRIGNELIENPSEVVSGVKDMYRPRLFGAAKPANGVLNMENEVRLDFNEPILGGQLTYNNFTVSGILNNSASGNNISLHFDGESKAATEQSIRMDDAYTLEGWFKQETGGANEQTLMQLGTYPYWVKIAHDVPNQQIVVYADSTNVTRFDAKNWKTGQWTHVAVSCESVGVSERDYTVYINYEPSNVMRWPYNNLDGLLTIGEGFKGDINRLRLWNEVRNAAELQANANSYLSHTTPGLVACYNLDEARGTTLEDISSGYTMHMTKDTWTLPEGFALNLDGTSYATLPMAANAVNSSQDFTLEFWFRNTGSAGTLLTTGLQEGQLNQNGLVIAFDANKTLYVKNGQNNYMELGNAGEYADKAWHLLTLTVGRSVGYARAYVDGQLKATSTQDKFSGIGCEMFYLGAMCNTAADGQKTFTNNFTGQIDELRLRTLYRPQYQIETSLTEQIDSTATALVIYYPMEAFVTNAMNITEHKFDKGNYCVGKQNEQLTLYGTAGAATEHAPAVAASALSVLDQTGYTFTPGESSIIFELTKPMEQIEHTILTFTAKNVRDVNGNKMLSPVTWSVYVNKNPLKAYLTESGLVTTDLVKIGVGDGANLIVIVENTSGAYCPFHFTNLPSWLTLNEPDGIIEPLGKIATNLYVSESLPIGTHTAHFYMVNGDNVAVPITLTVVVEGEEPAYTVNPSDYAYSMNVMGKIRVDGVYSTDSRDILYAFEDGKCVGKAYTTYYKDFDDYFVNLTVYSNDFRSHGLTYVIYDASTGLTHHAQSLAGVSKYQNNGIIGSPNNPAVFYNTKEQYRLLSFTPGWNWISLNVKPTNGFETKQVLGDEWGANDEVKLFNGSLFSRYSDSENKWNGTLTSFNNEQLFQVYSTEAKEVIIWGEPVDPLRDTLTIAPGWNGISYLTHATMPITQAMAGYHGVKNNDVLKSQTAFAIYQQNASGTGTWVGSLTNLNPGEGYMLKHVGQEAAYLVYPMTTLASSAPVRRASVYHETNMCLVAQPEGLESTCEGDLLQIFNGNEQVGEARLTDGKWYAVVAGDYDQSTLTFRYVGVDGRAVARTTLAYKAHGVVGNPSEPMVIDFADGREDSNSESDGVRKLILDQHVYIIRNGQWYTPDGMTVEKKLSKENN